MDFGNSSTSIVHQAGGRITGPGPSIIRSSVGRTWTFDNYNTLNITSRAGGRIIWALTCGRCWAVIMSTILIIKCMAMHCLCLGRFEGNEALCYLQCTL